MTNLGGVGEELEGRKKGNGSCSVISSTVSSSLN